VFDLPVSYDSDIDRALALMAEVGAGLQADPAFKDKILEPIEVVGVDHLAESGVVLKARIKTAPIQQWNVGREYNRRIKLAFDGAGIEIPVPHLKLLLSGPALEAVRSN
jgi:small conductance mechanosensitive channel